MSNPPAGMHAQGNAERAIFENEVWRIVDAGNQAGLTLRLLGSLAFQMHCPTHGSLQARMGRAYTDIDLAAYGQHANAIGALLAQLGYREDKEIFVTSEGGRAIFENPVNELHVDVFYDKLDFCHVIPWAGRLEMDSPTIPLGELLLEKMQIVKINEKDIIDTIMLLLEHSLGDSDEELINVKYIAKLCSMDWGLWRTTTMNLDKVKRLAPGYPQLSAQEQARVSAQLDALLARIDAEPKPLAWRLRDRVGDRVKWYKEIEEVK